MPPNSFRGARGSPSRSSSLPWLPYVLAGGLGILLAFAYLTWNYGWSSALPLESAPLPLGHSPSRGSAKRRVQKGSIPPPAPDPQESLWFSRLGPPACQASEYMRVCSHRGSVSGISVAPRAVHDRAPLMGVRRAGSDASLEVEIPQDRFASPPAGSLSAFAALWKAGVQCMDMDVMRTKDGSLLVAHPAALSARLAPLVAPGTPSRASELTLEQIRSLGLTDDGTPTVDSFLELFWELLESSGLRWTNPDAPPDPAQLPLVLLELKEEALRPEAFAHVAHLAAAKGLTPHVALYVPSSDGVLPHELGVSLSADVDPATIAPAALAQVHKGPLAQSLPDRGPAAEKGAVSDLVTAISDKVALVAPSLGLPPAGLQALAAAGLPLAAWVADDPEHLHAALGLRAALVISNRPLDIQGVLYDWRDRCSEQPG